MRFSVRRWLVEVLSVFLVAGAALAQHTPEGIESTAKITGKIVDADGKPAAGVRVVAAHLSSGQVFASEPTRAKGEYVILGLPYGYFDLAVETGDGLYIANRVVNVRPAGESAVLFTLMPFDASTQRLARKHPASTHEPSGVANLQSKPKGREFWGSPRGVALIAGVAGAGLLAIASGSEFDPDATQF